MTDSPLAEEALKRVLDRAQVQVPDGRPLYRYAVDDGAFTSLRARLVTLHVTRRLEQPTMETAALFVLYVSEWFRREYDGGAYRWVSPMPAVIAGLSEPTIARLARQGLFWWRRTPRRTAGGEMRLLSLVLEGGFPTQVLETRARGRISIHLRNLIARLEARGVDNEDAATALSGSAGSPLGPYDHREFHALSAELALAIVALKRRAAAAAPSGISASTWLDATQAGWRETLPIGLSTGSARRLLDELVSEKAQGIAGEGGCRRLLLRDGEDWTPALDLEMSGEVRLSAIQAVPAEGRLRIFASGALADQLAGELGLLEPPAHRDQDWLCHPQIRVRAPLPFPFEQAATVELRSANGRRLAVTWPRGEPLRSEVLVFADPRGDGEETPPTVLVHMGGGSLSTKRARVWLLTPPGFKVFPLDSTALDEPIWRGATGNLFETSRSVHAAPPDAPGYRIEVCQEAERAHQLMFHGPALAGVEAADRALTLYAGAPELKVRTGGRSEPPRPGEVEWRQEGNKPPIDWALSRPAGSSGIIAVTWGDPRSRASLDRQRICVFPTGAAIKARPMGERGVIYDLQNLDGWCLESSSPAVAATATSGGLQVQFLGRPTRRLALTLVSAAGRIPVVASAPVAGGGFCAADGCLLENGALSVLDNLRGAVAFCAGRERLYLRGPQGSASHVTFDDELPLWSLSEEIVRLLSASTALDDVVTLELGVRGHRLKVGRYGSKLVIAADRTVALVPEPPSGRSRRLDWLSVSTAQNRVLSSGFWTGSLPDDLDGPGIVTARQDGQVTGRPTLALGRPLVTAGLGQLQRATLIPQGGRRRAAIGEILTGLCADEAEAGRAFLLSLIRSLDGAPPAAIDALAMLPEHPAALAALALAADDEEMLNTVWLLERELPFLWAAIPFAYWLDAFATRRRAVERLLSDNGVTGSMAEGLAREAMSTAAESLGRLDPMLRTVLSLLGLTASVSGNGLSFGAAAQQWLNRTADDDEGQGFLSARPAGPVHAASCFRRRGSTLAQRLPSFVFDTRFHEYLDAPCAVALAAAAQHDDIQPVVLDPEQVRRARDARALEPHAFGDLYAAALTLLAQQRSLSL